MKKLTFVTVTVLYLSILVGCASTYADYVPGVQPNAYTTIPDTQRIIDDENKKNKKESSSETTTEEMSVEDYLAALSAINAQQNNLKAYYSEDISSGDPQQIIEDNISSSRQTIFSNANFKNSNSCYTYIDGLIYDIYFSPFYVTDIQLESGEEVQATSMGDPDMWHLDTFNTTVDGETITHLQYRPFNIDIATDCLVFTNRRIYNFHFISTKRIPQMRVYFRYPSISQTSSSISVINGVNGNFDTAVGLGKGIADLNFNYKIKGSASWKPEKVCSDTKRTYIQFQNSFPTSAEKPILCLRKNGKDEVVSYTVNGITYIVPIILATNELFVLKYSNSEVLIGY